jgi:hypothetical protein
MLSLEVRRLGHPLWRPKDKKIAILDQKNTNYFQFLPIGHQNSGTHIRIGIRIEAKCWIRIETNADPKH